MLQPPGGVARVRARLDEPSEKGLEQLMREGRNESEAVRAALVEARHRRLRRSALEERMCELVEQLRAVDVERLGDAAGRVTAVEMQTIDEALEL